MQRGNGCNTSGWLWWVGRRGLVGSRRAAASQGAKIVIASRSAGNEFRSR